MTMTKLKLGIISAVVVAGVVTPLVIQRQAQAKLLEENQFLRQRVDQLAQLKAQNERLSSLVAQANSAQSLPKDQLSELMRLRGEVGILRRQTNELRMLRTAHNEDPLTAASPSEAAAIPKESWVFVGYTTPETALQSVAWAMSKGDVKTFLASLSPETKNEYVQRFEGKTESEIATLLSEEISQLPALRLDRKKASPEGEVAFVLYSEERDDGTTKARDEAVMTFKKIGGEWKLHEPSRSVTNISSPDTTQ